MIRFQSADVFKDVTIEFAEALVNGGFCSGLIVESGVIVGYERA